MISVVIPAFNAAATIIDQLGAIARQSQGVALEVIVADNGSSDETRKVVEKWSESECLPVRLVDASARRGPAAARNIGASSAQGDLLIFTDADDVVMPGWLLAWYAQSEQLQFGSGPIVSFAPGAPTPKDARDAADEPPVHMGFLPYAFGSNFAVRRGLFEALGGFPEDWRTGEDVVFSWRLQLAGVPLQFVESAAIARRTATGLRSVIAQHYAYGMSDPRMFGEFRDQGALRPGSWDVLRAYAGLVLRVPLLFDDRQRMRWAAQLGRRAGRMVGSFRTRTLYW